MNFRTLTASELKLHLYAHYHNDVGNDAANELINRFAQNQIVVADVAEDELNRKLIEAEDNGFYDGRCEERDTITEWVMDRIVFNYKDKIEADVIDELCEDIRKTFEPLRRKDEEKSTS